MHVQRLTLENVRSIERFHLDLSREKRTAGWHVILGDNGAGKSSVVRALALALMGEQNAHATRQDWSHWIATGSNGASIDVELIAHDQDWWTGSGRTVKSSIKAKAGISAVSKDARHNGQPATIKFSDQRFARRTFWGGGEGWFSASFGPFRRFSGGDLQMDRLYHTHPRLAPHLSAFGENVALGESLHWLRNLQIKYLEGDDEAGEILDSVTSFINDAELLPHGAQVARITSEQVQILDGRGATVSIDEMSDGYRAILSLTFELIRLMFSIFGSDKAFRAINTVAGTITLPGVVAIDEVDAHLHPAWQQRIGDWFAERFPETQFFVTTHSPIICRAASRGSIWLLPPPGSADGPRRITGSELARLLDGNILEAYGTDLFGQEVTRSEQSKEMLEKLARLNRKRLQSRLSRSEERELWRLRTAMPSNPTHTEPPARRKRVRVRD